MKNRIIQLMPVQSKETFLAASEDGTRNVEWTIIGCALMDNGRILPVCWDGSYTFQVFDIERTRTIGRMKKMMDTLEK